ncbi:Zinc finger protein ZAT5 [Linum perenne]
MAAELCHDRATTAFTKGKRTKRQRSAAATNSSTSSGSAESTCTEEEDMANCLILLAQGSTSGSEMKSPPPLPSPTAMAAAEGFVYQCKTCERCFSSFQALGGHRASHKRPRMIGGGGGEEEEKSNDSKAAAAGKSVDGKGELDLSLGMVNTAAVGKVHECSICGAGFSSGQALGGHMRRHRTVAAPVRSGLELDLNLPAPEDVDGREVKKFRFVFSSAATETAAAGSTLVDCHF